MATVKSGINKVGDKYYQSLTQEFPDGGVGTVLYRVDAQGNNGVPIYDVDKPSGSTSLIKTFDPNATPEEKRLLSDPNSQLSKVRAQQVISSNPNATATQKSNLAQAGGGSGNTANSEEDKTAQGASENAAVVEELKKESKEGTRKDYGNVQYPENLDPAVQDCIKFSIFEYKAPGVQPGTSVAGSRIVSLLGGNPGFKTGKDRKILGTITLPIPGGINDSNTADWSGEKIDEFTRALANISGQTIIGGGSQGCGCDWW
jgi:hypothetical protein